VAGVTDKEREWADRARRFLKAELKRADVGYKDLVTKLKEHGLDETEASITGKLNRGTFSVAFFLACLTVLGLTGIDLEDL
jgi:Domain of unknown function (DUF6471)